MNIYTDLYERKWWWKWRIGTGGSGGSINRGPRASGPRVVAGHRKFLGKTLRKIIKIVATRWRILRLKCTKFDLSCGSAPHPAGGAYSAPPDPLAEFGDRFAAVGGAELGKRRGREREGEGGGSGGAGKTKGRIPSYCWIRAPQSLATPLGSTPLDYTAAVRDLDRHSLVRVVRPPTVV